MKSNKIIVFACFLFSVSLLACDANCVSCHPKLLKNGKIDSVHSILESCTQCHTEKENESSHGACGADCWSCHDISQVNKIDVPQHKVLPKCIKCHQSINKHLLEGTTEETGKNIDLLQTILNKRM